jgi:pyruvate/2-oxoacid:ferredoxin oxidoreductase beta subunit
VEACDDLGYHALKMIEKEDTTVPIYQKSIDFFRKLPPTPPEFINERVAVDMMLAEQSMLYVGGAGSCAGCGEATAIRMWLAALGYKYGSENIGIAASTGCNTVYGSTYPYNPYIVPWSNSLFENGPTFAMGLRMRWDQLGWQDKQLWVMGGDGAMIDIGFQALSRMLASGMNIKVLVLDTQVYSNTGGQTSTASFTGQDSKMYSHGSAHAGKQEMRKELGRIAMMHPNTYVAQTVQSVPNHFYKSVLEAAEFEGPAIVNVFTTCQPEHGVADNMARHQAKLAVDSRAFPMFVYDPRKGETIRDRLSLQGNPAVKEDWYTIKKTGETIDFITFARSEGRFSKQFDKEGEPSEVLMGAQADRLANWHLLQEMAGIR